MLTSQLSLGKFWCGKPDIYPTCIDQFNMVYMSFNYPTGEIDHCNHLKLQCIYIYK